MIYEEVSRLDAVPERPTQPGELFEGGALHNEENPAARSWGQTSWLMHSAPVWREADIDFDLVACREALRTLHGRRAQMRLEASESHAHGSSRPARPAPPSPPSPLHFSASHAGPQVGRTLSPTRLSL